MHYAPLREKKTPRILLQHIMYYKGFLIFRDAKTVFNVFLTFLHVRNIIDYNVTKVLCLAFDLQVRKLNDYHLPKVRE